LPRELPPIGPDESVLVVGRIKGKPPESVVLKSGDSPLTRTLRVVSIDDAGDLRRRWGQERVQELLGEGAGRPSLVDVARRYEIVAPYTSLYVPTAREAAQADALTDDAIAEARAEAIDRRRFWRPWSAAGLMKRAEAAPVAASATESDNKEGGTGTRAKGEEG